MTTSYSLAADMAELLVRIDETWGKPKRGGGA